MSLLVVGSMAYDAVETRAGKVDRALGGSATYFSMAASLFAPPQVVAVVGDDFEASDLDRLSARGVDLSGVTHEKGHTFRWGGRYADDFSTRETLFTELNVFSEFQPHIPDAFRKTRAVFLANIHPALQLDVLEQVEQPDFVALDTMNFWIHGERPALLRVLARTHLLFVNDEEAYDLTGANSLPQAAARILELGPRAVVIKRGEHGSWLFTADRRRFVPAVLLDDVVDPTGAGDTFAGGTLGYLAAQGSFDEDALDQALVVGTLAASFVVEGFSVDALEPRTVADLEARRQRFEKTLAAVTAPIHGPR